MSADDRRRERRTLKSGEFLGLKPIPDGKWRIEYLEYLRPGASAPELFREKLLPQWREMQFDSADDAAAFVEKELAARPL